MKKSVIALMLACVTLFSFAACSDDDDNNQPAAPAKTFVLVHGSWQGAFVWQSVKTQLEQHGQKVVVVELPAHGDDTTAPQNVTIDAYRDKVLAAINATKQKVVLVGHSMGGAVITAIAEKIPAQIEKLVYIGAFVPANGQSILELSGMDKQSALPASLTFPTPATIGVKPEKLTDVFCQDGSAAVKEQLVAKYRDEPAIPFTNKAVVTAANFGSVDKYYIHTNQDHTIGIDLQNQMAAAAGIKKIYALNTGHSPFLSKPDSVSIVLLKIIE
ncbi:Pimeloyl-ACP methyl ester carboxylesterase [Chitinophaga sp. YR627]|uniref:alpha/beta fold hydrolase n=1 Tax=Chitinophaga sp. YR627 TaxID=1881041 RepID=UPI0008E102DA|nr:alpha/beta fold hydrolase [Chitinophaga sp. YR627]SFO83088.1 Pimeloyl-ACP methyl ester carboxylesterase [Chitinophaga sp. YR627]